MQTQTTHPQTIPAGAMKPAPTIHVGMPANGSGISGAHSAGSNMPEKRFRSGVIAATIWKRQSVREGKTQEYYSISLDRSYKDKQGAWQHTNNFRLNDLPRAKLLLDEAFRWLVLNGAAEGASAP